MTKRSSIAASPNRGALTRTDRVGLRIVATAAIAWGLAALAFGIAGIFTFTSNAATELALPVSIDVPKTGLDGTAMLVSAVGDRANVVVSSLSGGAIGFLSGGLTVSTLTQMTVVACVVFLITRLLAGRPFLRSVSSAAVVAAFAVIVGGASAETLTGMGQMQIATELAANPSSTSFRVGFTLDMAPFAIGLAITVVAVAFHLAERLQRDTDGLV